MHPTKLIIGFFQWLAFLIVRLLLKLTTNVKITIDPEVMSLIKHRGPILMVANHRHEADPFTMLGVLPIALLKRLLPMKFITANGWYFTFWPFAAAFGCYPSRHNWFGIPYGVDGAIKYIQHGYGYAIFPEGRRVKSGGRLPAKTGVKRILDQLHGAQLILVHLEWHKRTFFRRNYTAHYKLARPGQFHDAQDILDTIYELKV